MYCDLPFYHLYIDGKWIKPCCINTEEYKGEPNFNHKNLVSFRQKMLKGGVPESCNDCKIKEDSGVTSYREYNQELNPYPVYDHNNGIMKTKPFTFDIRLDNTCNLKCVMCGPDQSSKWLEDIDVYKDHIDSSISYKKSKTERLSNLNIVIEMIKDNASFISLLGGEPFQMKSAKKLLNSLSDWNRENTKILITTNAMIDEDNDLFNVLTKFKKVYFMISIDGTNDVNEYIRYPSTWIKFLDGVNLLQKHSIEVRFNLTVSALNLPDIQNVQILADKMNIKLILNNLHLPEFLTIDSLKPDVIVDNEYTKSYKFNPKNNKKLKRYLCALDEKRKTNSKEVLKWCWI